MACKRVSRTCALRDPWFIELMAEQLEWRRDDLAELEAVGRGQ